MGSYCSVHNDTNDLMYIKYGPNMAALRWATTAAALATAIASAGTLAGPAAAMAVTGAGLGVATAAIDDALKGEGYRVVSPGGTYKSDKLTLSLFLQASIVLKGDNGARRAALDCWTGPTDNSCNCYNASQAQYETISF